MADSGLPCASLGHHKKGPARVSGSIAGQIGALGRGANKPAMLLRSLDLRQGPLPLALVRRAAGDRQRGSEPASFALA
jgi:hypothetical protein